MSHHEGVSCDSCLKGNFRGRRYKCLICFDYDCCATCYENGVTSNRHSTDHPMQCILTRHDFDLFYGGENLQHDFPQSYTCPFCGRMGLTESALHDHVSSEHSDSSTEVICAICASIPGGEANNVTDDFAAHLTLEHHRPGANSSHHNNNPSHLNSQHNAAVAAANATGRSVLADPTSAGLSRDPLEEPQTAIRGRRAPHASRSSLTSSSNRTSRRQMQYTSSVAGLAALQSPGGMTSNSRDMDPIAELLSQLSGVRRAAAASNSSATSGVNNSSTTASQLQQLQMQLQLERNSGIPSLATRQGFVGASSGIDRVPIERVIRRHQQQSSANPSSQQLTQQQHHHAQLMSAAAAAVSGSSSGSFLVPDMPYIVLMDQNPTPSSVGVIGSGGGLPYPSLQTASSLSAAAATSSSGVPGMSAVNNTMTCGSRFLLSRCNEDNLSDSEQAAVEVLKADKALFVQELIVTTLSDDFSNLSCLDDEKEETGDDGSGLTSLKDKKRIFNDTNAAQSTISSVSVNTTSNTCQVKDEGKDSASVSVKLKERPVVETKKKNKKEEFQLPVTLVWVTPGTTSTTSTTTTSSSSRKPAPPLSASGLTGSGPETPLKVRGAGNVASSTTNSSRSHSKSSFERV